MELTLREFLQDSYITLKTYKVFFPTVIQDVSYITSNHMFPKPASRCFLKPDNKINKQNKNKPFNVEL